MSQGPSRGFPSHYNPTMPPNSMPRQQQQQVMNNQQSFQQAIMTSNSPPNLGHVQNTSNTGSSNSGSPNNTSRTPSTQETIYCDSCQTFRHVSFFHEKDFKYNVCKICQTREMQKRKHQMERYDVYDDQQQRNYKQPRYPGIQYTSPQHQQQQQLHSNAPITLNSRTNTTSALPPPSQTTPPQVKQSPPIASVIHGLTQANNNNNTTTNATNSPFQNNNTNTTTNKHIFTTQHNAAAAAANMRNQSQIQQQQQQQQQQSHLHSQSVLQNPISLPLPNQQQQQQQQSPHEIHQIPSNNDHSKHRLDKNSMNATTTNGNVTPIVLPSTMASIQSHPAPSSSSTVTTLTPLATHHKISASAERASQDIISLDQFVKELEKEVEFDRKPYHLDIGPLMESMGETAGFTQLGRGICERVLEGTKFNFSLKDRRRSTKSPETLSTLRYYCSQRIDTAKPRKVDHPKAQLRYDCAGALTIIIDLLKKTAHVTVIHKHQHPPFVSQHHHQQQQKKAQQKQQQQRALPQQQQQQLVQHLASPQGRHSSINHHQLLNPPQQAQHHHHQQAHQQAQQQAQQQAAQQQRQEAHMRMLQRKQVDRQFDLLRQRVAELGLLLETQQKYGNKDFLQTATDALSGANELLAACKAAESSSMTLQPNKYTLHYTKREDHLV